MIDELEKKASGATFVAFPLGIETDLLMLQISQLAQFVAFPLGIETAVEYCIPKK